ncbi:MAG TPA: hypothetical protein VGW57_07540 [Chthoniobacterales bacterium]|nr:hypothetical protein [Chthoniobacterales bacterium]
MTAKTSDDFSRCGGRDIQASSDFRCIKASAHQFGYATSMPQVCRRPSKLHSLLSSGSDPHLDSFHNQFALKLRDRRQNIQLKLGTRIPIGRIDALARTDQRNLVRLQFRNDLSQVTQGTGKSVDFPRQNDVNGAFAYLVHHDLECASIMLRTRSHV